MNFNSTLSIVFIPIFLTLASLIVAAEVLDDSNLKVQPQFDRINILDYLNNEQRLKLQLKCILFDGPCDAVGHWIKRKKSILILK